MSIAIVGAGLSGTLLAAQLVQHGAHLGPIYLIERSPPFARGLAYSTTCMRHLLNVPAGRMAAQDGRPQDLTDWLARQGYSPPAGEAMADTYVPRALYAEYVAHQLEAAEGAAGGRLRRVHGEPTGLRVLPGGLQLQGVAELPARLDHVVLCSGHLLPRPPRVPGAELLVPPVYIADPWDEVALDRIAPTATVALLGAGLTMVDVALRLTEPQRRFRGTLTAVSRHGLLPQSQRSALSPIAPALQVQPGRGARALMAALREAVRQHEARGGDWRQVVDSLRALTPALWQALGPREQARVLRHAKTLWDVHRHRIAPQVAHDLHALRRAGTLGVSAGRLARVAAGPRPGTLTLSWQRRHGGPPRTQVVDALVNCTGGHSDVRRPGPPLWEALREQGHVRPGPHGMGLDVEADGQVRSQLGVPSARLWAMGPLRVGRDFESVAVPELRTQAAALAARLAAACAPLA